MTFPESTITAKGQTTIPLKVRKMLNLKPNTKIMWISLQPDQVNIIPIYQNPKSVSWAKTLSGKYANDNVDAVKMILDDKKKEVEMEDKRFSL